MKKESLNTVLSPFVERHIGPGASEIQLMLKTLQVDSLQELTESCAPKSILAKKGLDIGEGLSEEALLSQARQIGEKNKIYRNFIGLGYYDTITPTVILRNVFENPGWYTAYTPYQAEISQGRMEALLNFQTMVQDLTGKELANASLLDEGTAVAEAATMAYNYQRKSQRNKLLVFKDLFPQSLEVLKARMLPLGIEVVEAAEESDPRTLPPGLTENLENYFAVVLQYPTAQGEVIDYRDFVTQAKDKGVQVIVAADLLSLCLLSPPGEWGADIVVGTTQRFGVPMGFGGPHAAYLATSQNYVRLMPGRLIGVSKDRHGKPALRLTLQTREQHIRRERATSNICTAQVLLAVMAGMYAVYHGPKRLKEMAESIHSKAQALWGGLKELGLNLKSGSFFDTLAVQADSPEVLKTWLSEFEKHKYNLGHKDQDTLLIALDETTTWEEIEDIIRIFSQLLKKKDSSSSLNRKKRTEYQFAKELKRSSKFLTHPVFNSYHSETEMLRYIRRLELKDLSLNQSMIPLGSCTMKLNATTEMIPVTWPEFSKLHPFAPLEQTQGYMELIKQLEGWICEITGFSGCSLQPNAGSQGEYAGLLAIQKYHAQRGESHRNICLIPSSAHGTNPASAVMAGMKVVVVKCDEQGNVDLEDLKSKAELHSKNLSALMVTYPSTHGVFEESITDICNLIHEHGGQVYMDGANLNALVGVAKPGEFGADVCHLNLHKTFCIPHGGGGPGVGPIAVAKHLKEFLPKHSLRPECGPKDGVSAISSAPWGSASILPISWAYIAMMGSEGLKKATQVAILNANYVAKKLSPHFPILYTGKKGFIAHECIIDVRPLKESADITVDDIAKRLMDFGFHAPTMSWPVPGTLMIEPTESESLGELDRFCEAMIAIRKEVQDIEDGKMDRQDNPLKNAPHCVEYVTGDDWAHSYPRTQAAYPLPWVRERKFWPAVGRVDNAFGDKNLFCSCPPLT